MLWELRAPAHSFFPSGERFWNMSQRRSCFSWIGSSQKLEEEEKGILGRRVFAKAGGMRVGTRKLLYDWGRGEAGGELDKNLRPAFARP